MLQIIKIIGRGGKIDQKRKGENKKSSSAHEYDPIVPEHRRDSIFEKGQE